MTLQQPTESYVDKMALNIRILQIIEKHKLETQFAASDHFILQGESNNFYDDSRLENTFVMAIKLPMTKADIKTGSNFEGSALDEFLQIKDIFDSPITEVINLEQHGEEFKAERYHMTENLGEFSFNLVDNEMTNNNGFYRNSGTFHIFGKHQDKDEQIVLYIQFDPIFMMFNNSYWSYRYTDSEGNKVNDLSFSSILTDSNYDLNNLQRSNNVQNDVVTRVFTLYSLYNIYLLSQRHHLGLKGSFIDLVSARLNSDRGRLTGKHMLVNGVHYAGNQNLSKDRIDILLLEAIVGNGFTIDSRANNINPLDTNTYARFLFSDGDKPRSMSAFEILSDTFQAKNIIDIKKYIPRDNNLRALRTELFLPTYDTSKEQLVEDYLQWVGDNWEKLHQRWETIVARASKYSKLGFVHKIALSLLFIKKYIWPYFHYSHSFGRINQSDKTPILFTHIKEHLGLDISEFFGVEGYEDYFAGMHKANASVTSVNTSGMRFESMGTMRSPEYYGGIHDRLYFTQHRVLEVAPRSSYTSYLNNYNPTTIIIINDSYTKQAWKPKIKAFIEGLQSQLTNKILNFYVLSTKDKLETMMLTRVFKDRGLVYQFSKFEADIEKPKHKKKKKEIKLMHLNNHNHDEVNRRRHWGDCGTADTINTEDKIFIAYSNRHGFYFGGQYHDAHVNNQRLHIWEEILRLQFKKFIWFISEKDLSALKEEQDVMTMDDFFHTDEFKEGMPIIANTNMLLSDSNHLSFIQDTLNTLQYYFLKEVYHHDSFRSRTAEHLYYQFIALSPNKDFRNALIKLTQYFPAKTTRYNDYHFAKFMVLMPNKEYFDHDIFKEIAKERETVFTENEILVIKEFSDNFRRKYSRYHSERDSLNVMLDDIPELLKKSNYLNLNIEDTERLIQSRLDLYLVDLLTLMTLIPRE